MAHTLDSLPFHWNGDNHSTSFEINDVPRECIDACSASGDISESVEGWRKSLGFYVNREQAIGYLQSTGAWTKEELEESSDDTIGNRILWMACCNFHEYIVECERAGVNPFEYHPNFESNCGSRSFYLSE